MNAPRVITHAGLSVELSTIKSFHLNIFEESTPHTLTIEFKTRYAYIRHPLTGELEKQEFNETAKQTFYSYDSAMAYLKEWEEIWQDYLDD